MAAGSGFRAHDLEAMLRHGIEESIAAKRALLRDDALIQLTVQVGCRLVAALKDGHRLFLCGNGGSAADAQHIAAELVGKYKLDRPGLPVFALTVNSSSLTAIANDDSFGEVFSRQLQAMGSGGDVLIAISTSGNSRNVISAVEVSKRIGLMTVGLTGRAGGRLKELADCCICVPADDTARIQEVHIVIGHLLAEMVEAELFGP